MFHYPVLIALAVAVASGSVIQVKDIVDERKIVEEKELVLAFVVNRHGERTPDADELSLSDEQEKLRNLTRIEGLEGLTNVGKRRAYQIGKFIRQRYGVHGLNLISNLYLQDEIYIRSTDKERTKMTVLVAMAGAYPPEVEQQWDEYIGKVWQPVPYTAVPLSEDFLRYYSNCEKFKSLMAVAKEEAILEEFLPYKELIVKLKQETGRNFTEDPLLFQTLFDLFRSQVGLGLDIPKWARPLLPQLSDAARLAYKLYFRSDEMKRIGGGVLLHQFLEAASDLSQGKPVTKPLRIYSGHDFNIGSLIEVTRTLKEHTIPEYGSVFMLELYKSRSGVFSVVPVFLNQAGESSAQLLRIAGCSSPCDLNKFKALTQEFALPERDYYATCGIHTEL